MAKIVSSPLAPQEPVHYSFAGGDFELDASKKTANFESADRNLLSEAENHPWLEVKYDKVELLGGTFRAVSVDPAKDPLSAQGPNSKLPFDPEAIKAQDEANAAGEVAPVAIDAGLDQNKNTTDDAGTAKTIAAAEKAVDKAEGGK